MTEPAFSGAKLPAARSRQYRKELGSAAEGKRRHIIASAGSTCPPRGDSIRRGDALTRAVYERVSSTRE